MGSEMCIRDRHTWRLSSAAPPQGPKRPPSGRRDMQGAPAPSQRKSRGPYGAAALYTVLLSRVWARRRSSNRPAITAPQRRMTAGGALKLRCCATRPPVAGAGAVLEGRSRATRDRRVWLEQEPVVSLQRGDHVQAGARHVRRQKLLLLEGVPSKQQVPSQQKVPSKQKGPSQQKVPSKQESA